jgi:hypothetical protein
MLGISFINLWARDASMRCFTLTWLVVVPLIICLSLPAEAAEPKPVNLEQLNTDGDEDDPHLSSDGLRLYYTARAEGKWAILESVRKTKNGPWPPGKRHEDITTLGDCRSVFVTPDGKFPQRLFFATNAKGENFDLFYLTKQNAEADFTTMTALPLNTPKDELHPWLTADGQSLYFSRKNPDGWHIYVGKRSVNFARPKLIDLPAGFHHPTLTADGKTMFLQGPLPEDRWGLFRSTWNGQRWSKPEPLDWLNNPNGKRGDQSPSLSRDGNVLFFASDRPGGKGGLDLWYVAMPEPAKEEHATAAKEEQVKATKEEQEKAAKQEQEAARQLKLAKTLARDGKAGLAKKRYQEIVEKYPKTKAAEEARRLLDMEE